MEKRDCNINRKTNFALKYPEPDEAKQKFQNATLEIFFLSTLLFLSIIFFAFYQILLVLHN